MTTPNPEFVAMQELLIGTLLKANESMMATVLEHNQTAPLAIWPGALMVGKRRLEQLLDDVRAGRVTTIAEVRERVQQQIDEIEEMKNSNQKKRPEARGIRGNNP